MDGLETVRTPLLSDPPELPPRPDACDNDAVWELLCACMQADEKKRPTFSFVASGVSDARQSSSGKNDSWL